GDQRLLYSYFSAGPNNILTALATAPTVVGDYQVVAHFAGGGNYSAADSSAVSFSIGKATPTVTVSDGGGLYNSQPFPATDASVTGIGGDGTIAVFGDPSLTYSYYRVAGGTRTQVAGPPTVVGDYEVVAHFQGNANYDAADSLPTSFAIGRAN